MNIKKIIAKNLEEFDKLWDKYFGDALLGRKHEFKDIIHHSQEQLVESIKSEIKSRMLSVYRDEEKQYVNYTASEYNKAIDDILELLSK